MAAEAAHSLGHDVRILSKKRKSEMFGAQYLHQPIPGMTNGDPIEVSYRLTGSISGYRQKVYGPDYSGPVSPDEYGTETNHLAWDIRQTYGALWQKFGFFVEHVDFKTYPVAEAIKDTDPEFVISSIPAPLLCQHRDEHSFMDQIVYSIGDAPERGIFCPIDCRKSTVLCNGLDEVSWYRVANVFGHSTAEWPASRRPPYEGVAEVRKPLKTTCNCLPNVMRVGRYGKWSKGVLSHTAYIETCEALTNPQLALF